MPQADDFLNASVLRQIRMQRVAGETVRKVLVLLARVETDIIRQLRELPPEAFRAQRLNALLDNVQKMHERAYAGITEGLLDDFDNIAAAEATWAAGTIRTVAGAELGAFFVGPSRDVVIAAVNARPFQGRFLKDWLNGMSADQARRVREAITITFTEGESLEEGIARIRGTRAAGYKNGVMEVNRRGAERLVRTATTHLAARARLESYRQSPNIDRYEWSSVLDSRTSMVCAGRDGKVYELDKGPLPPAHINCRSQINPVFVGEGPAQRRTYGEWLQAQPTNVQNEVLGPTRAKAFRAGERIDRFTNRRGDVLTLEELRRREMIPA